MNRFSIFVVCFALLIPFIGQAQSDYLLNGKFSKQDISGKVYLHHLLDGKQIRDSAEIKNGVFVISGKVNQPEKAYLEIKYKEPAGKLKLENREIYLDKEQFSISILESLKSAEIKNSAINSDWQKYREVDAESRVALNDVIAEYRDSSKADGTDTCVLNRRKLKVKEANNLLNNILANYVLQNPDNYFSFSALDQIAGPYMEAEKIENLFKELSPRLKSSPQGKELRSVIDLALTTSIGKVAPGFTLKDINNKEVSLAEYRGKYVLLDFWASWCGPCRAENPNVVKAYEQNKSKNFTVLGLSVDRKVDRNKWLKAVEEDSLPWAQIIDVAENSVADVYSIKSIPANYLINPEGVIIAKNLRGTELLKVLGELPHN